MPRADMGAAGPSRSGAASTSRTRDTLVELSTRQSNATLPPRQTAKIHEHMPARDLGLVSGYQHEKVKLSPLGMTRMQYGRAAVQFSTEALPQGSSNQFPDLIRTNGTNVRRQEASRITMMQLWAAGVDREIGAGMSALMYETANCGANAALTYLYLVATQAPGPIGIVGDTQMDHSYPFIGDPRMPDCIASDGWMQFAHPHPLNRSTQPALAPMVTTYHTPTQLSVALAQEALMTLPIAVPWEQDQNNLTQHGALPRAVVFQHMRENLGKIYDIRSSSDPSTSYSSDGINYQTFDDHLVEVLQRKMDGVRKYEKFRHIFGNAGLGTTPTTHPDGGRTERDE
jgi:hypothetical protein